MQTANPTDLTPENDLTGKSLISRVDAIDILRALTMVLMIFVNDLWSLKDIPAWLGHVASGVDGIGLADIVFPAFLFIVGMSLPYAIDNRRKKGETDLQITGHILMRTVSLLVMGVFLVNGESYNAEATGMPRMFWNPICCLCFILIWNAYPAKTNKSLVYGLKALGIITLLIMAFIYRGGKYPEIYRFSTHWWGILGLIGWAYLAGALVVVIAKNRLWVLLTGWAFFAILSMMVKAKLFSIPFVPGAISGGTLAGLTMGGIVASQVFRYYRERKDNRTMTLVYSAAIIVLVILSILTRPYWGLAKLGATPAWLFLCSAFTLGAFVIIYWISDVYGKSNWFNLVKPAGKDTLLCYLMPYFVYFLFRVLQLKWPEVMITGGLGLLKSLLLALFCVWLTKSLNKLGVRLKL